MDPKTQYRVFLYGERLWLAGVIIGVAGVVYFILAGDNDSALFFLGFFVLSGLLYLLRKRQRVRFGEKMNAPGSKIKDGGTRKPG
jgi:LPXTG-motif cell wall-anchored protein